MTQDELTEIIALHKPAAFIDEFHRQKYIHGSNEAAYQAVEARYQKVFGEPKYASLKSFETVMYRHLKRKERSQSRYRGGV